MGGIWNGTITALVLTYNRKELLSRCLEAILGQTERPDEIIVLDNGSSDGTCEYLRSHGLLARLSLFRLQRNIGPAGGIAALFQLALERGSEWIWFMDDDTIPDADALRELKHAYSANFSAPEEVGFLRSFVVFPDGSPFNMPLVDLRHPRGKPPSWADRFGQGLIKVRWCQLNSILIPRSTIVRVGSVSPVYFFAGEDEDFTRRITDVLPGYIVGRSHATHLKSNTAQFSALREASPERIKLGKYYYRNGVYLRLRRGSFTRMVLYVGKCLLEAVLALSARTYPLRRSAIIISGVLSGLLFVLTGGRPIWGLFSVEGSEPPFRVTSDCEGVSGAAE
jgi:GT2 family glycosyltransferase